MYTAGPKIMPHGTHLDMLAYPGMRPVPGPRLMTNLQGYGNYTESAGAATVAAAVGIGLLALVVTVGFYALLAYTIGWGASKGWKAAKRK